MKNFIKKSEGRLVRYFLILAAVLIFLAGWLVTEAIAQTSSSIYFASTIIWFFYYWITINPEIPYGFVLFPSDWSYKNKNIITKRGDLSDRKYFRAAIRSSVCQCLLAVLILLVLATSPDPFTPPGYIGKVASIFAGWIVGALIGLTTISLLFLGKTPN